MKKMYIKPDAKIVFLDDWRCIVCQSGGSDGLSAGISGYGNSRRGFGQNNSNNSNSDDTVIWGN